jgi:hypothetical protein
MKLKMDPYTESMVSFFECLSRHVRPQVRQSEREKTTAPYPRGDARVWLCEVQFAEKNMGRDATIGRQNNQN